MREKPQRSLENSAFIRCNDKAGTLNARNESVHRQSGDETAARHQTPSAPSVSVRVTATRFNRDGSTAPGPYRDLINGMIRSWRRLS